MIFNQRIVTNITVLTTHSDDRDFTAKVNEPFGNEWCRCVGQPAITSDSVAKLLPSGGDVALCFDDKLSFAVIAASAGL